MTARPVVDAGSVGTDAVPGPFNGQDYAQLVSGQELFELVARRHGQDQPTPAVALCARDDQVKEQSVDLINGRLLGYLHVHHQRRWGWLAAARQCGQAQPRIDRRVGPARRVSAHADGQPED